MKSVFRRNLLKCNGDLDVYDTVHYEKCCSAPHNSSRNNVGATKCPSLLFEIESLPMSEFRDVICLLAAILLHSGRVHSLL